MLVVYTILSLVTICTTIVAVYFLLNGTSCTSLEKHFEPNYVMLPTAENYNWQWAAVGSAGSTAGYVFLYSIFYFFYKTQMTGLLQVRRS